MKKRFVYSILLLVAICATGIRVHAQGFGTELPPCTICGDPCGADPCSCDPACSVPPPPPTVPPLPITPPPPDPTPPDTALPKSPAPCVANPCSCNPQSCGIPPTPSSCQSNPCACNPAQCAPYTGPTPSPNVPHASVTVTPTIQSAGSNMEYITATAPAGSIFSYGPLGIVFAINPQTSLLDAASGGGTSAIPWNVNSYIPASFGGSYTEVEVINTNAEGVINFTIVAQITIGGATNTQTINVTYTQSTNSCTILLN